MKINAIAIILLYQQVLDKTQQVMSGLPSPFSTFDTNEEIGRRMLKNEWEHNMKGIFLGNGKDRYSFD